MTVSFDLITQPWVPCVDGEGRPLELGLAETLARSHELRELEGESPLVTAALHRLLLAVLHRVFGPAGYESWRALWEAEQFDAAALDAYFDRWRDRFDLFHPTRPFYQAADARVAIPIQPTARALTPPASAGSAPGRAARAPPRPRPA